MSKRELAILEKAFQLEFQAGLGSVITHVLQTKSKLAKDLADRGMLTECTVKLGGRFPMQIHGYELTHLGRMTYGESCKDE